MSTWARLAIQEVDRDGIGWVDLAIQSDVSEIESVVDLISRHCFSNASPRPRTVFRLRVALAEAISNAILRGNRGVVEKLVRVRAELTAQSIRIGVGDEGDGLDRDRVAQARLPECLDEESGRGLYLIKCLADQVEVDDRGNTIWMTLPRF